MANAEIPKGPMKPESLQPKSETGKIFVGEGKPEEEVKLKTETRIEKPSETSIKAAVKEVITPAKKIIQEAMTRDVVTEKALSKPIKNVELEEFVAERLEAGKSLADLDREIGEALKVGKFNANPGEALAVMGRIEAATGIVNKEFLAFGAPTAAEDLFPASGIDPIITNPELADLMKSIQKKLKITSLTSLGVHDTDIPQTVKSIARGADEGNWTMDQAEEATKRIQKVIDEMENRREDARTLRNWQPKDAAEALPRIEEHVMNRRLTASEKETISDAFKILSPQEQKKYVDGVKERIRGVIAELELEPEDTWKRGSIQPREMALGQWLDHLKQIAPDSWDEMDKEEQARKWLHLITKKMLKGESPFATKDLLGAEQEYDDAEFHERIAKLPGVNIAFRELEKNSDQYFKGETKPEVMKRLRQQIVDAIKAEWKANNINSEGITAEDAYRLGYRFWKETGREAQQYSNYIEKNHLLDLTIDPKTGIPKVYVDPQTPLLFDPLRLVYCPKAMWVYFGFGGDRTGKTVYFVDYNGKIVSAKGGVGVGADVLKKLFESKIDFLVQDYFSRRRDQIVEAWGGDQLNNKLSELNINPSNPFVNQIIFDSEDQIAWNEQVEGAIQKAKLAKDPNELLRAEIIKFQRETIKDVLKVVFAKEFSTQQVWGDPPNLKTLKENVDSLRKRIMKIQGMTDAEKQALQTKLDTSLDRYEKIKSMRQVINKNDATEQALKFKPPFESLGAYDVAQIPFSQLPRGAENVRANARDHFNAVAVYQAYADFINDPSLDNFMKLPVKQARSYAPWGEVEARIVVPAYNAFVDVQKGGGPFGGELFGLAKSKYGEVFDTAPIGYRDLYKIRRACVREKMLSKQMAKKLGVVFTGPLADSKIAQEILSHVPLEELALIGDKLLMFYDPTMVKIALFAYIAAQLQQIMKEQSKE